MTQNMYVARRQVRVHNVLGLHMRAADEFVKLANSFQPDVNVCCNGVMANGKSILSLMTLMAPKGTTLVLKAKGERSEECVAALAALIADKFGEGN